MSNALPPLPIGWQWTTVEQVGAAVGQAVLTGPFGTSMGRDDFVEAQPGTVPVLTIGCLRESGIDVSRAMFVPAAKAAELDRYRLRGGDILFSRMATVGRAGFVEARHEGALFNYHIMRLRLCDDAIEPRFFIYFVRAAEVVQDHIRSVNHGMTRDGINTEQLLALPVPVAPRQTQIRIVDAIESYLTRIDAAVTSLERARAKLKAYRASVLKAAVEGRLVPTDADLARKEKRDYEPANILLARILEERRHRWEQTELAKLGTAGKPPKDNKWKLKYEEPEAPDTTNLPALPAGWCWATLDQLAESVRNGESAAPRESIGTRILRISAVRPLELDLDDVRFLPGVASEYSESRIREGDLLFTRYNGNVGLVGACARVPAHSLPTLHPDKLIKVRLLDPNSSIVAIAANTGATRSFLRSRTRTTAGQAGISGADLRQAPVPLPPAGEAVRISAEVDRLLSVGTAAASQLERVDRRCARLRRAVLSAGFQGRLVDQDPNDESAELLLARIRTAGTAAVKPKRNARARARARS